MPLNARSRSLPTAWWVSMCCLALWAGPGLAQDATTTQPASPQPAQPQPPAEAEEDPQAKDLGPMAIEIDLDRLLFNKQNNAQQDPVWRLSASPGKRTFLLPFTVDNVHRVNKLSRFPITIRSSRFVGFVIPKPVATNQSADSVDFNRIIRAAPDQLQEMLFEKDDPASNTAVNSPEEDQANPTPDNAPRLTREITLHPDGTVRWSMDRSIRGAQLQGAGDQNPYAYKIDPQQLRDAAPPKAERLTRNEGEDSRAYALRKREHELAEREKQNAYRELRDSLRKLPESFSEPVPHVLYAVIEVPNDNTLTFQGPAPLPWTLDDDKKQLFDKLSRGAEGLKGDQGENQAGSIITMIKKHPLDARAVALATTRGRLASSVETDDPGYELITRLLQSNDIPTRRIALLGVAKVTPPSLASAKLIGVAGEAALGEERKMLSFASLSKMFSTQAQDPDSAAALMQRVSQTIADPEGPSAPRVIEKVLESLANGQATSRGQADTLAVDAMIESIDLSGVEADEVADVTKIIIQQSPTHPVAAGWLDQQLLGSTDKDVVNQTLSQLYELTIQAPQPDAVAGGQAEEATEPEPALEADALIISGTIPMTRPNHALIGLFDSSDDLQEAAAWAVLGRFHLALPKAQPGQTPEADAEDPALKLFDSILAKADQRDKVPASVVRFIVNQDDPAVVKVADDRLVALLGDQTLSEKTARAALDAYLADPQRYSQTIAGQASQAKRRMIETMYRSIGQEAPLMAGLVADRGETLRWMNDYIKEQGQLPTEQAWIERAESLDESSLISQAASGDDTVSVAAAAALVVRAGGTVKQEQAFAQTVVLLEARTQQEVQKQWSQLRSKIFASAYKRSQGTYKLVVTLFPKKSALSGDGDGDEQPVRQDGKRVDLGLVELSVEGLELSLSVEAITLSPAPNQFGIQIDKPSALRSFDKAELSKIAPEHLASPIILLPKDDGAWAGQTGLPDGQTLRVSLEPAN